MFRLLITSIFLLGVSTEHSLDEFVGDWLPAVTYPKHEGAGHYCHWFNFRIAENLKCTCGAEESSVMKIENRDEPTKAKNAPIIIIDETEDAVSNLKKCICKGGRLYPIVFKKINANYFITYSAQAHGDLVDYSSAVFVKKVPRLAELQAVLNSVSDLRGKEPNYMCPPSSFA